MSTTIDGTLPNVLAFCRTYESGSFTKAAKALRVTPAAVSRSVARLETALGARLFRRTTRELRPTEKGIAYYARSAEALALLESGEREVREGTSAPRGVVRISAPTTYGLHLLLPGLSELRKRHPDVELELQISNQNVDFVREGFDLAIRMGSIDDASLIARKLGDFSLGVFASPDYVARRGAPKTLEDLAQHETIAFMMPRTGRVLPWMFAAPSRELVPSTSLRCSDDPNAQIALGVSGQGLFQTYHFMVRRELGRRDLVEALKPFRGRTRKFSLLYPRDAKPPQALRVVIDEIVRLAATPALRAPG